MMQFVFIYFIIMSVLLIYSTIVGSEADPFDTNLRKILKERKDVDKEEVE